MTAAQAAALVKPGDRVFVHGSAATPLTLVHALFDRASELHDVELVSVSTMGDLGLDRPGVREAFFVNALFVSANVRAVVDTDRGDYVPVFLSEIPRLFEAGILPIDVALVHVSPPDRHGYCSLGVSVDVARSAVVHAKTVIAQVNPHMPRTHGDGHVHVSLFAAMVEVDDPLPEVDYGTRIGACERGQKGPGGIRIPAFGRQRPRILGVILQCLGQRRDQRRPLYGKDLADLVDGQVGLAAH